MTTQVHTALPNSLLPAPSGFVAELFERSRPRRSAALIAIALALVGHALASTLTPAVRAPRTPMQPPLELEFVAPEPPPPPIAPPLPEPKQQLLSTREPAPRMQLPVSAKPQAPPPVAAAPAVLTAKDIEPQQASPDVLDFTSDPTQTQLSSGVVAVGGTGHQGRPGAVQKMNVGEQGASQGNGDEALVGLGDLSRRPRLPSEDPCAGFFPSGALDDSASVALRVVIKKDGSIKTVSVMNESPAGQGFGAAARTCMSRQRFVPALDRAGNQAATAMKVNVRFRR